MAQTESLGITYKFHGKITVSGISNAVGTANEKIVDLKLGNGNHSYKPEEKRGRIGIGCH